MKENVFLKVGYTTYLEKKKEKKESWTSRLIKKIVEHKFISVVVAIVVMCGVTNLCLIYKFLCVMEELKIGVA